MLLETQLHGVRDRMLALRSLPNYATLPDDSLLYMAEHARERRFRAGERLYDEDTPIERLYIVIGGTVATSRRGQPYAVIEAPGGIGIIAALAAEIDGWRAEAVTDVVTLEIPAGAFFANLEEDFPLLRNSLRILSTMAMRARGHLPVRPDRAPPLGELGPYPERDHTLVERIIGMRSAHSPFESVNMDAVIEIARRMIVRRVEPGHEFFGVGELADHSIRINYGRVRCMAASGEHVDVGNGMVLGALDSLSGQPRSYGARAETRVVCYQTPIETFLSVIEMHPAVGLNILRGVARSLLPR